MIPPDLLSQYCHHIIPYRHGRGDFVHGAIIIGHGADAPLLKRSHGFFRHAPFCGSPVFHFRKNQIFPVPADQIDLPVPAAVIPLQDPHSFPFQIGCRKIFCPVSCFPFIFQILSSLQIPDTPPLKNLCNKILNKASAVYRRRAILSQGRDMLRTAIALIGSKTILRINLIIFHH